MAEPRPVEIRLLRGEACLEVDFDDGMQARLPAEYLRVESPSAEVQGHGPGQAVVIGGKRAVNVEAVEPVGHYAVLLRFSDGHNTGLYSWALLHQLAREQPERWRRYLDALANRGLRRDA